MGKVEGETEKESLAAWRQKMKGGWERAEGRTRGREGGDRGVGVIDVQRWAQIKDW